VTGDPSTWIRHATIVLDGDDFIWKLDAVDIAQPRMAIPASSFRYRLLEKNDVGAIGAFAEASNEKPLGPVVKATVIVLNKKDMTVRTSVVGIEAARDTSTGSCDPK
jgi:hypothetical protein